MSTPTYSIQTDWQIMVDLRREAINVLPKYSALLNNTVSANAIAELALVLGKYLERAKWYQSWDSSRLSAVSNYAKVDTNSSEYDFVQNAEELILVVENLIKKCNEILPTDEDGYLTIRKIDDNGVQTVKQLTTTDTGVLKMMIDGLVAALGE